MHVTDLHKRFREEHDGQGGLLVALVVVIVGLAIGALSLGSSVFRGGADPGLAASDRLTDLPLALSGPGRIQGIEETRAAVALRMKVRSLERHRRDMAEQGVSVDGLDELIEYQSLVADSIKPRGGRR